MIKLGWASQKVLLGKLRVAAAQYGPLAVVLCVSLLLRLGSVYWGSQTILVNLAAYERDSSVHIPYELAENLLKGRGFSNSRGPTVFWPPLYPMFLATVELLFGKGYVQVWVLQALFGTLTVLLTYLLAKIVYGERVGLWAAVFVGLCPSLIIYVHRIAFEILCLLLVTTALVLATAALRQRSRLLIAISGIFGGLAILTRSELVFVILVLTPVVVWSRNKEHIKSWLIWTICAGIVLLPWLFRNYTVTGHIVPVATNAGYSMYLGNNPRTPFHVWDAEDDKVIIGWYYESGLNDYDRYIASTRLALEWMTEHPLMFLQRGVGRILDLWGFERYFFAGYRAGYYGSLPSGFLVSIAGAIFVSWITLCLFALVGFIFGPPDRYVAILITLPVSYIAVAFIACTYPRHQLMLISVLAVLGAYGLEHEAKNLRVQSRLTVIGLGIAFFVWVLLREILWGEFNKFLSLFR